MDVAELLLGGMEVFTMRASCSVLALAAMVVGAVSAQAESPRGTLYQTMIEDAPQQRDVEMVSYQQFNSMEQRLAAMEARLSSVETVNYAYDETGAVKEGTPSGDCGCGSSCGCGNSGCCGGCNDCWCHPSCGWTVDAQLLFLRAHESEANDSGDEFDTATRTTIGCIDNCGREWRVRYFEYATDLENSDYVQLEYIDLEYAGRFTLGCNWRGELSGGLRWAQFDEEGDLQYSDTYGPMLGAMLHGPCVCGIGTFASLRNSWQFGSPFDEERGTFSVTEVQIGAEWTRCLSCGGTGFLRGVVEADKWEGVFEDDSQDLGLIGFGLAVGVTR
jgi:hypothetical protein